MEPLKPEVVELLTLVQEKYQKPLRTTTDYEEFTLHLAKHSDIDVSPSTLKRLWGYVNDRHSPRKHTLDKLSQYLGYIHFDDFCQWLRKSSHYNSSFFSTKCVDASTLSLGGYVQIGWAPNRLLMLKYQGHNEFEVVEAQASKLLVGDHFSAPFIYKNFPLYLPWIDRKGQRLSPFIAGRNGGITIVNVIDGQR